MSCSTTGHPRLVGLRRAIVDLLVLRSSLAYRVCKRYVDMYNGDNNSNLRYNGELDLMREYRTDSAIVFDIGANVGEWGRLALSINPRIGLHCFEPSRATYDLLTRSGLPSGVKCVNIGLGSANREAPLYVYGEGTGMNSLYRREGLEHVAGLPSVVTEEVIGIETMDGYCARNGIDKVDFAKLDVEGHELEVLRGMSECLRAGRVRIIQFEYGGCNIDARVFLKDIWDYVTSINPHYVFHKLYPGEIRRISRYSQLLENFQYQNWAIIRTP